MGILANLKQTIFGSTAKMPQEWFFQSVGRGSTDSGVVINQRTALTLSWVWQATNIISNDVGKLPLVLYDRSDSENRQKALMHPAYKLIKRSPNRFMNAKTFKALLTSQALLTGNGLAAIVRDRRGAPVELIPLDPSKTKIEIVDGEPMYLTKFEGEQTERALFYRNVLHIKGLGNNGYWGHDVVSLARNSFGLGLAAEKHGSATFKNNARPSVVLESEASLDQEKADQIISSWTNMHSGVDNASKTALLSGGLQAKVISMSNENTQWIESRKFQREEVASWFNISPNKLGSSDQATSYRSAEASNQAYLDSTLMNWLVTWEEECDRKLISDRQLANESLEFEFLTASLLRADLLTRYQAYQIAIQGEFMNPNEVRRLENMPKRTDEDGDKFQNPNTKSAEAQESTDDEALPEPAIEPDNALASIDNNVLDSLKILISDRLERMVRIETKKIKAAASKPDINFVLWMETFYDDWQRTVTESLAPCIGVAGNLITCEFSAEQTATYWVDESVERLLEVAGNSYDDNLADNISTEIDKWASRPETTTLAILKDD
jgi:HK97 family phage portal protein